MTDLIRPTINNNGTDARELIEFRVMAKRKLEEVIDLLKAITPNGRDYIGDTDLLAADRDTHFARISDLRVLQAKLLDEALLIKDQTEGR
jgi:hypothetical protein